MKRSEFLAELKEALEHDLGAEYLKKNIDYYDTYIREAMKKGEPEEEVVASLGDPWAIAKTIRMSAEMGHPQYTAQTDDTQQTDEPHKKGTTSAVLWIVAIVVIVLAILSMAFGLLAFVIRYAFPILLVLFLVRLLMKK